MTGRCNFKIALVGLSSIETVEYKGQCVSEIQTTSKSMINDSCTAELINDTAEPF